MIGNNPYNRLQATSNMTSLIKINAIVKRIPFFSFCSLSTITHRNAHASTWVLFIRVYHNKKCVRNSIHHKMSKEKIYAISDLHVDQDQNMLWVERLSNDKYLNDTVIIAGGLISNDRFVNRIMFFDCR